MDALREIMQTEMGAFVVYPAGFILVWVVSKIWAYFQRRRRR